MHSVCNILIYNKFSRCWFALLGVVLLTLTACPAKYEGPGNLSFFDGSVNSEGDADFNPTEGDPFNPDPDKVGETCNPSGTISISTSSIDFGLGQILLNNELECQSLSVSPCLPYEAEINQSPITEVENNDDPTKKEQLNEFVLKSGSTISTGRVSVNAGDQLEVCYRRLSISESTHKGSVHVVVGGGSHAFVIPITGKTLPNLFKIDSPQPNQLVWEQTSKLVEEAPADRPYFKYFEIPANVTVNLGDYGAIIKKNHILISVQNGGITKKIGLDENGALSAPVTIEIPDAPKIYPVAFSIETNKGTLIQTIPVIRFYKADATVEVRNNNNELVGATSFEDLKKHNDEQQLTVGIKIPNLNVAGPFAASPIDIRLKIRSLITGKTLVYKGLEANGKGKWIQSNNNPPVFNFYAGYSKKEGVTEGICSGAFKSDASMTFCAPLPPTANLDKGANKITAYVCNDYEKDLSQCTVSTHIIVDNNLPQIEILGPLEPPQKTHYEMNEEIKLIGIVKNVAVKTVEDNDDVNAMEKDDKGKCIKSSLTLWINESVEQTGIPVCVNPIDAKDQGIYSGNKNNIKKASFTIDLTKAYADKLKRYTNLIQLTAENYSGHKAIKVVSFQRGQFKKAETNPSNGSNLGNIISGKLGDITANKGKTKRSPVMLNISEGSLENEQLIAVIEHLANENLHFEDIIQGYIPEEKSGDIPDGNDEGDIDPDKDIKPNSHLSGVAKIMAWKNNNFQNFNPHQTDNACDYNTQGTCAAILFPKNLDDPRLFGKNLKNEPFWSPVVFGKRNTKKELLDMNGKIIPTKKNGWPVDPDDISDIASDYNFYDIEQGPITVDKINLDHESVTAHLTIHGFSGHAFAFAVCEYGALSFPPVMPIVFNIKELKLRLDDIQIKKIQLDANGHEYVLEDKVGEHGEPIPENRPCTNNNCTNKLIIDPNNIKLAGPIEEQGIYMSASKECKDTDVGAVYTEKAEFEPFGCNLHPDFVAEGHQKYNWVLMETRNELDYLAIAPGPSLIVQLQEVLRNTIKDQIWCDMPKTLVNPIIDPVAFTYPEWFPEEKRTTDLTLAVAKDTEKDEVVFGLLEKFKPHEEAVFTIKPDIKNADLIIEDGGIKAMLPLELGANNVQQIDLFNKAGHLYRDADITPRPVAPNKLALSASLNIEEILHAASNILIKKGVQDLLDLFDVDDLKGPNGYAMNNWTLGLDKVIFGRFDVCGDVGGLLKTDLPPSLLFKEIKGLFVNDSTHWDITLDPHNTPTILLEPVASDSIDTEEAIINLGLSNVQVAIHDLLSIGEKFKIANDAVVKIRLDGIIKIRGKYIKALRKLQIFIPPLAEQTVYLSVINGGPTYHHPDVVDSIYSVLLNNAFTFLSNGSDPSFIIQLPEKLSDFNDACMAKISLSAESLIPSILDCTKDEDLDKMSDEEKEEAKKQEFGNGLVIINHSGLGGNGQCDGKEPQYANHSLVIPGINTPLLDPTEHLQLPDQTGPVNWLDLAKLNPQLANALQEILGPVENDNKDKDKDEPRTVCLEENEGDNDILESFYDVGIKEISFEQENPEFELDFNNGYIHISTELKLDVCDDLFEEVNP